MNHAVRSIGDGSSVTSRFGSTNGRIRPEKLINVLCYNNTGAINDGNSVFMQVHEITNSLIPAGTKYSGGGSYTLTGLTVGHTYSYSLGANDTQFTNNAVVFTGTGTFVAAATTAVFTGTISATITASVEDLSVPQSTPVPAEGAVPRFSFPVFSKTGGTLDQPADMTGVYCCWSSTQATKTIAAASGEIVIVVKA